MLNIINLPSLAERRLRTRLVMMYKVSFHVVAVPSDIVLIFSDTRTRKYHPLTVIPRYMYLAELTDSSIWFRLWRM
jgi:hypothetical protein